MTTLPDAACAISPATCTAEAYGTARMTTSAPSTACAGVSAVAAEFALATLAQVSETSGLNVGYLSQIENDKAVPSLEALGAIAAALDVPPAWLLLDSSTPPQVVYAVDRPRSNGPGGAVVSEVDGHTSRDVCIIEAVVPPGQSTGAHAHNGDEHHVVLSGRWRMSQGDHTVELGPGDYLAWDPTIPHDVENI